MSALYESLAELFPPVVREPEEWRVIFDGFYEVSSHGNVRRAKPGMGTFVGRPLLSCLSTGGYLQVLLSSPSKSARRYVHHLVAEAFLGARPANLCVNHKDANKTNNSNSNLEYVTWRRNAEHAVENVVRRKGPTKPVAPLKGRPRGEAHWSHRRPDRIARGARMPHSKLTEQKVVAMREARASGRTLGSLAAEYGLSIGQTWRIVNRTRWEWVK